MMLSVNFVTLFPEMVLPALRHSMLLRAEKDNLVRYDATNPRDFATDPHRTVDDKPFGGGPGMLLRVEPMFKALESLNISDSDEVIFTEPTGQLFNQTVARELSQKERLIFVCGHYEGIDHRVQERFATRCLSLGDFILTGGEFAALTMTDAIVRLLPGVLGDPKSLQEDSHFKGLLSYPQFTRPQEYEGMSVPEVLLSGNHQEIDAWRRKQALNQTRKYRPDLFCRADLSLDDLNRI